MMDNSYLKYRLQSREEILLTKEVKTRNYFKDCDRNTLIAMAPRQVWEHMGTYRAVNVKVQNLDDLRDRPFILYSKSNPVMLSYMLDCIIFKIQAQTPRRKRKSVVGCYSTKGIIHQNKIIT